MKENKMGISKPFTGCEQRKPNQRNQRIWDKGKYGEVVSFWMLSSSCVMVHGAWSMVYVCDVLCSAF